MSFFPFSLSLLSGDTSVHPEPVANVGLVSLPLPVGKASSRHAIRGRHSWHLRVLSGQGGPGEGSRAHSRPAREAEGAQEVLHVPRPAGAGARDPAAPRGGEVWSLQGNASVASERRGHLCWDGDRLLQPPGLEEPGAALFPVSESFVVWCGKRALRDHSDISPQRLSCPGAVQRRLPHLAGTGGCQPSSDRDLPQKRSSLQELTSAVNR